MKKTLICLFLTVAGILVSPGAVSYAEPSILSKTLTVQNQIDLQQLPSIITEGFELLESNDFSVALKFWLSKSSPLLRNNAPLISSTLQAVVKESVGEFIGYSAIDSLFVTENTQVVFVESQHEYGATYTKQATQHDVLPSQALILAVPFTSWEEASRLNYLNKDILNPSWAATTSMVLQYWGEDTDKLQDRESLLSWASWEDGKAQSLDEIKPWLAQNIPVMVTTGLTPTAHPLYSIAHVLASGGFFPEALIEPRGPSSWMLGSMVAYDVFQQIEELMNVNFVRESVVLSTRVVVGYDDAREIVILHDPRFGAAWEVSYKDFEAMWAATDRFYSVAYPANYVEVLNQLPLGLGYSSRTSAQQAAEHYVLGYALGIVGDTNEAAEHFRQGLAISGISQGYKHLLQFELAVQLFSWQGTPDETLTALQKAIDLLPENPAPWAYLAHVYDHIGLTQEARDAKQKANQLCNSQEARSKVFEVLPADLQLFFCPVNQL